MCYRDHARLGGGLPRTEQYTLCECGLRVFKIT